MAGKQLAAAGALGLVLAQGVNAFGGGADVGKLDTLVQEYGDVPEVRLFMEEVAKAPEAIQMVLNEGEECKPLRKTDGLKPFLACRKLARELQAVTRSITISELTLENTELGKIESEQGKQEVEIDKDIKQLKTNQDALINGLITSTSK